MTHGVERLPDMPTNEVVNLHAEKVRQEAYAAMRESLARKQDQTDVSRKVLRVAFTVLLMIIAISVVSYCLAAETPIWSAKITWNPPRVLDDGTGINPSDDVITRVFYSRDGGQIIEARTMLSGGYNMPRSVTIRGSNHGRFRFWVSVEVNGVASQRVQALSMANYLDR